MNLFLNKETAQQNLGQSKEKQKFQGFDFLRAIFSIIVVALHADLFNLLSGKLKLDELSNILTANVGYLAVPVFFQISLFLFCLKRNESGEFYFIKKRLPKLTYLYLFWTILLIILNISFKEKRIILGQMFFENPLEFIISGGYTPYYFFFSLIFLTMLAEITISRINRIKNSIERLIVSYGLLVCSCCLIFLFSIIDLTITTHVSVDYEIFTRISNYLNFLPYVFTAVIVSDEFNQRKLNKSSYPLRIKMFILLIFSLVFTVLEWILFENFPHYARLSLVFSSWLLLYMALIFNQKAPTIVKFLSKCSLGIYGFHVLFTQVIFTKETYFLADMSKTIPGLGTLAEFFLALISSIALTLLFRRIR